MIGRLQKLGYSYPDCKISPSYKRYSRVTASVAGNVSKTSQLEVVDLSQVNGKFKMHDFSIINLMSVGADKLLQPCMFSNVNYDSFLSDAQQFISHVTQSVEEAK